MTQIAHFNMVEQQIRPWNIRSQALLEALMNVDRSQFVPKTQQHLCWSDIAIELPRGQMMLEPKNAAHRVQALELQRDDRVLVVGVGSGYTAALCAKLGYLVHCIDADVSALDCAKASCAAIGLQNISFTTVERLDNPMDLGEFDAILCRAPMAQAPEAYFSYLASNGRCVAQVGTGCVTELMCYRQGDGAMIGSSLLDVLQPKASSSGGQQFEF